MNNPSGTGTVQDLPKSIFTPDEACYLLYADTNQRARLMHERGVSEMENTKDKSLNYDAGRGEVKFFRQQNFYYCYFYDVKDYDAFRAGFIQKDNKGKIGDCVGGIYAISGECFACDMDFRRELHRYQVMIMRSTDFSRPENRRPPKKRIPVNPNRLDDNDIN